MHAVLPTRSLFLATNVSHLPSVLLAKLLAYCHWRYNSLHDVIWLDFLSYPFVLLSRFGSIQEKLVPNVIWEPSALLVAHSSRSLTLTHNRELFPIWLSCPLSAMGKGALAFSSTSALSRFLTWQHMIPRNLSDNVLIDFRVPWNLMMFRGDILQENLCLSSCGETIVFKNILGFCECLYPFSV